MYSRNGASGFNAGTGYDATTYYVSLPSNRLSLYLYARLLWNPDEPMSEVIGDWCQTVFGAAAAPNIIVGRRDLDGPVVFDDGDEVILSDPRYACYPNMVHFAGGVTVDVPVYEEDGFQFHPQSIRERITPRTRAVMINSPSNPTGTLLAPANLEGIAQLGIPVISDEIYHGLVYEGQPHSILEYTDEAFVLDGLAGPAGSTLRSAP